MKDTLFFLWSGLFIVIAWVVFTILHAFTSTTISSDLTKQIAAIKPAFDIQTIATIKTRDTVIPLYTLQTATQSATPTPYQITGLVIPVASPSSATATIGGTKK